MTVGFVAIMAFVIVGSTRQDPSSNDSGANVVSQQWNDTAVVSPMDNTRSINITNTAIDGATQITANPILTVTCFPSGNYDVNINVGVGGGRGMALIPNLHGVHLKFDDNPSEGQLWSVRDNTGGAVMYTTEPSELITELKASKTLLFEFTPLDEPTTIATFNTAGLQDALAKYPECMASAPSEGKQNTSQEDSSASAETTQPTPATEPSNPPQEQQSVQPTAPQEQQPQAPIERRPTSSTPQ
ncbi:MAG: hypothetical protein HIU91_11180 [Acidobacteria bacterium]|nr:hypothetical protein [Acidobacteriota bacterium]